MKKMLITLLLAISTGSHATVLKNATDTFPLVSLRGLAARCGKLLLIQHHVDILADIFQGRDIRLQGFQFGTQFCAAGLQRRK
mgnify:CR=1 FL=1